VIDREAAIAKLLTVQQPSSADPFDQLGSSNGRQRRYEEARIDVGDIVTIIGSAIPFGELADPSGAAFSAARRSTTRSSRRTSPQRVKAAGSS